MNEKKADTDTLLHSKLEQCAVAHIVIRKLLIKTQCQFTAKEDDEEEEEAFFAGCATHSRLRRIVIGM